MKNQLKHYPLLLVLVFSILPGYAQVGIRQKKEKKTPSLQTSNEYTIGGIRVSGSQFLDEELLISIAGLSPGDKIKLPYDTKISKVIQNLWKQNLFSDIAINTERTQDDKIFLDIHIAERPRLSKFNFKGIKDNDAKELKEKMSTLLTLLKK